MIKQIIVKGIGSYGEETPSIELGNGKNVIVGENATGKSALLFSFEVGFLGSLEEWDLTDVINDNSREAEVILDFTHPKTGNTMQIYRRFKRVRRKGKEGGKQVEVFLKNLDTGEVLSNTPKSVQRALETMGIEKNVFINVVHVKQGKINRILRSSASQREMFDKLFGIHDLKNAVNNIGSKRGNTYSGLVRELDNKRRTSKNKINEKKPLAEEYRIKKKELNRLRDKVVQLRANRKIMKRKLEQIKQIWMQVKFLVRMIDDNQGKIETSTISFKNAETSLKRLYSQLESIYELYVQLKKIVKEAKETNNPSEQFKILEVLSQSVAAIEQEESKVNKLSKQLQEQEEDLQKWFGQKSVVEKRIENLDSQIIKIRDFIHDRKEQPMIKCELCGSILKESEYEKHLQEIKTAKENLRTKFKKIKTSLRQVKQEKANIEAEIKRISGLTSQKNKIMPLMEPIKSQLDLKMKSFDKLNQGKEDLKANLAELSKILGEDVSIQEIEEKASKIKTDVDILPVQIKQIDDNIKEIKKKDIPKLEMEVKKRKEAKKEVKKLKKEVEVYTQKRDFLLGEIRPALNDIQPVIRRFFLDSVNNRAMTYFNKLYGKDSKYKREEIRKIWMDDEYRFWVDRFGHTKLATRLSGGQGIIVSLCFLFALLDELGSALGFLLLDEPSTHLDDKRVEELISVLKELQNVPQLIVVDHKQELIDVADIKYHVTLENGFSRISRIT